MGCSEKQKMLVLQKVLPPSSRPVHEVSKDTGITAQTIYKWMKQLKDDTIHPDAVEDTIPRFKTDLEKFILGRPMLNSIIHSTYKYNMQSRVKK